MSVCLPGLRQTAATLLRLIPVVGVLLGGASAPAASSVQESDRVTSRTEIRYGHAGGEDLLLDVFLPDEGKTSVAQALRPAVLLVHGGGWAAGSRHAYHPDALWFARHGLVCFSASYRLVKPQANKWPAQLDDVQLAVRWIREHAAEYGVDPGKIGAVGGSAGGHLVALLGTCDTRDTASAPLAHHSSRVTCVVNFAGPSDLSVELPGAGSRLDVQKLVDDLFGKPARENPDLARSASPLTYASAGASPFLIVHGDKDPIVPVDQATRFHSALKEAGADSTLLILPGEGHGLSRANHELFRRKSLEFFRRHLDSGSSGADNPEAL